LQGNATATDRVTGLPVTLNSQGDGELIFLHNPGTAQQQVSRLALSDQVDDTLWVPSPRVDLLVVDSPNNTVYRVQVEGHFKVGTVFTEAPSDSPTPGIVGTVDLDTGQITPIITGLGSPTGLLFVADADR
jgi:hypothetical protein